MPIADREIRQKLLAHSDVERSYIYSVCEPSPLFVRDYIAIIRVLPVAESGKTFVEWWATLDCAADERDRWTHTLQREGFAKWLAALRTFMAAEPASRMVRPA